MNSRCRPGVGRWTDIYHSDWTLVVRPGAGIWPRAVTRYVGLSPLSRRSATAAVGLALLWGATRLDQHTATALVTGVFSVGLLRLTSARGSDRRRARVCAHLVGGRLVEPVRLDDPDESDPDMPRWVWARSGNLAVVAATHDPGMVGVLHELLWAAGEEGPRPGWASTPAREERQERTDPAWRAWTDVATRALSLSAGRRER